MWCLTYFITFVWLLFFILNGTSLEMIFLLWFISGMLMLMKLYSYISYMLLMLELLSMISICLMMMFMMKSSMELSFFSFDLFDSSKGLPGMSLMVMKSWFQKSTVIFIFNLIMK